MICIIYLDYPACKPTLVSGVKIINVRENREEQSRMDKPETLATLDTQDTGRRQNKTSKYNST
jgi:hypothetical protein